MNKKINEKQLRKETLKENGVDVCNFFDLSMKIPFGAEVKIIVDGKEAIIPAQKPKATDIIDFSKDLGTGFGKISTFEGKEVVVSNGDLIDAKTGEVVIEGYENDIIVQGIIEDGYVKNSNLFRRWIAAQTFKMLNYKSYKDPKRMGWEACMKDCFNYNYQFTMLLEEIRVLSILQKEDPELFNERSRFFNTYVINTTLNTYIYRLNRYIKKQRKNNRKTCKKKEYVKLTRYGNVFVEDLNVRVYKRIAYAIKNIEIACDTGDYNKIYGEFKVFMDEVYNKLPYDTVKCQEWKDAFKASGAYYTLQNLIRFHHVTLYGCFGKYDSETKLKKMLDEFRGEEWRLHNILVETISDNNFDLRQSIKNGNCAPNTSVAKTVKNR